MRRFVSISILALAVLGAQVCAGSLAYACEMDEVIHRACCCEGESGEGQASASRHGECGCCEVQVVETAPASGTGAPSFVAAPAVASSFAVAYVAPARNSTAPYRLDISARAPTVPPAFLAHCALLI